MSVNEKNFIKLLKKKNEKALDYVIDNYGWLIKHIVKKQLYNLEFIQDECINDIFMAIWGNIDKFNPNRGSFKNWIIGISKFKTIDFQRKYIKEMSYEDIDDLEISTKEDTTSYEIIKNELSSNVEELLNCLKKEDQEIFIKRYIEEKDIDEISKETGLKKDVIYNRVSKGKRKIRKERQLVREGGNYNGKRYL